MMAEVQQPHKQHIATLPHTTTSSPVTTTPQQLLQKQHNHSKIINKKRKSHSKDPTSAGWCSSPTLPPAQQLPQRPRSCLMMAEVQQPHKQHIATLPHTTTSSPVTTTPQLLLQKQHNHSKIIKKKKEISQPRSNVCRLVFFSNAPASAAAPASPT